MSLNANPHDVITKLLCSPVSGVAPDLKADAGGPKIEDIGKAPHRKGICYEFLRVSTHQPVVSRPATSA